MARRHLRRHVGGDRHHFRVPRQLPAEHRCCVVSDIRYHSELCLSPRDAWEQPILRFADTVVGVAIGITAAWIGGRVRDQMNATGGS